MTQDQLIEGEVSVIMPAFNAEGTLRTAIDSVRRQTHTAWKLYVIDDGSKDSTAAITEEVAQLDPRVALLRTAGRVGAAGARNLGIQTSDSEFIAFLDADDLWYPEKLEVQLDALRHSAAVACCSAYQVMDHHTGQCYAVRVPPQKVTYERMLRYNRIGCLTLLYSQKKTGKVFMPEQVGQEDWLTWLDLLRRTRLPILGLAKPLAKYRVGSHSLSSDKGRAAARQWHAYRSCMSMPIGPAAYYFSCYALHTGKRAICEMLRRRLRLSRKDRAV